MVMTIGERAPDENQDRGYNDRTDQRHIVNGWLTLNVKVEHANYQKNGQESDDNGPYNAIRGAPSRDQFAYNTYQGCDNNPDDQVRECDGHISTSCVDIFEGSPLA